MRTSIPKSGHRFQTFTAAAAAAIFLTSTAFAVSPAGEGNQPAVGGLRQLIHLLEKDDNDVVIKAEDLPKAIRDYIAKEMPDAKVTGARKDFKGNKEKTGDNFTYEVDVKQGKREYELRFDHDGKFVKKRENAGDDADDKK